MAKQISWTISDLVKMFDDRRRNEYDCILLVTGLTGKGKSTLILKFLSRFKGFQMRKHLVYSREDTINLLRDQKFSFCWNDELIASGYKREHWNNLQIQLIKILTQYRCNWNIFAAALPVFFTADKEMLKQFSINIDVIGRGEGIIHMRRNGRRYNDDPWDTKYNAKLEDSWSKMKQRNPNFKIPYWKYTTYVGHLYWNDITKNQREIYESTRDRKKAKISNAEDSQEKRERPFYESLYAILLRKELDEKALINICEINNKKIANARAMLNKLLRDSGRTERVNDLLIAPPMHRNENREIIQELEALNI